MPGARAQHPDRNKSQEQPRELGLDGRPGEQDAQRYARYLQLTYARPAFAEYTREERFRDFVSVFGSDLKMLDARMQRFLDELGAGSSFLPGRN